MFTEPLAVSGSVHFLRILGAPFGRVFHGQDHLVGTREQVHRTAHAGGFLARDDPVGQVAFFIDLQGSQYRSVHMTAADDAERGGAVEARGALEGRDESAAGIDKFGVFLARCGGRAHTEQAVFALQEDLNAFRQVIGDGRRSPIPRFTTSPSLSSIATRLAMISLICSFSIDYVVFVCSSYCLETGRFWNPGPFPICGAFCGPSPGR